MKWLKPYNLSVVERKGFVALATVLIILICIRVALIFISEPSLAQLKNFENQIAAYEEAHMNSVLVKRAFNPNQASDSLIKSFVISKYTAESWIKHLERGKTFQQKEDLLRLYGMDTFWFEVNKDSIILADAELPISQKNNALFYFDPNHVTISQMQDLGLTEALAQRIKNYRQKGGSFKTPEDLQKIYGFPEDLYARLKPYINIAQAPSNETQKTNAFVPVEINSADSLALLTVKGIGPAFAKRIIQYRTRLGGFYSMNQLMEVYGITDEKLENIKPSLTLDASTITRLDANKATFKELLAHPYLNYDQVKVLVNYREKVGSIKAVGDLLQLEHFSENDTERLAAYLKFD